MKRSSALASIVVGWAAACIAVASCAQGSSVPGLGGSGAGAGPFGGSNSSANGLPTSTTTTTTTTGPTTTSTGGAGGMPTTTSTTSTGGGFTTTTTTGPGGSTVASTSASTTTTTSSTTASSSSGGTGFGPCVTQAQIDSQNSLPFEIDFCVGNIFACIPCSCPGVNPGDPVCSPNCVCAPLPPLCGSDAGTDAPADAPGDAATDAGGPMMDAAMVSPDASMI